MTSAVELCDNLSMPFSRIAENRIREAMDQGQFEDLPGAGRPLNLEEYFSTPEDLRMAYSILKSAHCVPAEVELLNEVSRLERAVAETADATERQSLQRALTDRQMQLAVVLERRSRRQG
jgi:DnaJ homologue, subfamily C, member 28, conserved domain